MAPCKICGSTTIEFLQQFELLKCTRCDFIFYRQALSAKQAIELYNNLYNQQDDYAAYNMQADQMKKGEQPHLGYDKMQILKRLEKLGCTTYAEIGAGVGIVGKYLQSRGWKYDGFELDKQAANHAKNAGVNVKNGTFEELEGINGKDCTIAFEVIEHIDDLKLCLQLLSDAIKKQGYFGFTVPNFKKYYNQSKERQKSRLDQVGPPVHINFFTEENLKKVLPMFGFEIIYLKVRAFPPMSLKRKITYIRLLKALVGLYHGPTILCIAQKK